MKILVFKNHIVNLKEAGLRVQHTICAFMIDLYLDYADCGAITNDLEFRTMHIKAIELLLNSYVNFKAILNYEIVCDETCNPPSVIDQNDLVTIIKTVHEDGTIYIKGFAYLEENVPKFSY